MTRGRPARRTPVPAVLITGGCGFIGCNTADAIAMRGEHVLILDNLARAGSRENADWLKQRHGEQIELCVADIRDSHLVTRAVSRAKAVLHLAAQVAVTTSLIAPTEDFEINARGTLNVLEAVRLHNPLAPVVFASTNKVYGRLLSNEAVVVQGGRYVPADQRLFKGVSERTPIDLYSPYGCSKGAADLYVRDYARVFGLRTAVLRMSCVYGARQFGTEDQGWIAHFLLQAKRRLPITIYGDGRQVRDALHITDAVSAWLAALDRIDEISGGVFNLGGGPKNSLSLRELIELMADLHGATPETRFAQRRPGDQPWYISDVRAISAALDWQPTIGTRTGIGFLERWLERRFGTAPSPVLDEARA